MKETNILIIIFLAVLAT